MRTNSKRCSVALGAIAVCIVASPAMAQTATPAADEAKSEEIVVTAERTASTVQATPIAITAFSGAELSRKSITDVGRLGQYVPGLNVATHGFAGSSSVMAIRGVGSANLIGDPTVAFHIDGEYFSGGRSLNGALYDLERIEVLKGPQGTLYGRNSTAGVVNVIIAKPKNEFDASLTGTYGNYNQAGVQGMVNVPLIDDVLAARLAVNYVRHDGYQKAAFVGGQDIYDADDLAIRGSILLKPSADFSLLFSADYFGQHNNGAGYQALNNPYVTNQDPFRNYFNTPLFNKQDGEAYRMTATWELGGATLTSLTAYRIDNLHNLVDQDGNNVQISTAERYFRDTGFQQELRLNGTAGIIDWQFGGFYYKSTTSERFFVNTDLVPNSSMPARPPFTFITPAGTLDPFAGLQLDPNRRGSKTYAVYTHNKVHLTDAVTLTVGARYNHDKNDRYRVSGGGTPDIKNAAFDSFTWKVGLDWKPDSNNLLYASVGTGFKAGGTNEGVGIPPFNPEKILAFEVGSKSTFLDGKARVNTALFYYDYSDLQVSLVINNQSYTQNAAKAKVWGGEIETTLKPVEGLSLNFSASYVHSDIGQLSVSCPLSVSLTSPICPGIPGFFPPNTQSINVSGNPLAQAPELTFTAGAEYVVPMGPNQVGLSATYSHQSSVLTQIYASAAPFSQLRQGPSHRLDAAIRFEAEGGRWFVEGFGNNLTDERVLVAGYVIPPSGIYGAYAPPRTYGVRLGWKFH